jgi:hypothetical protein
MSQQVTYYLIAGTISFLALMVAVRNFRRKSGIYIRGGYGIGSSVACRDSYLTNVILENIKDRAVTIYAIYLRVGHNYYLEVENHEDKPLVLRPYETYKKDFGPIEFYSVNSDKIDMNTILKNPKVKKQLVLSTSEGKYKVPSKLRRWTPINDFFKNHMTAIVRTVSSTYKQTGIGGNAKYVLEIKGDNNNEEIIPIYPIDFEIKKFNDFNLSKQSLESKENLVQFLDEQINLGKLVCQKFVVHDLQAWRERAHEFYKGELIEAQYYNWFQYRVLGKIGTKYSTWKLKRENIKRQIDSNRK